MSNKELRNSSVESQDNRYHIKNIILCDGWKCACLAVTESFAKGTVNPNH